MLYHEIIRPIESVAVTVDDRVFTIRVRLGDAGPVAEVLCPRGGDALGSSVERFVLVHGGNRMVCSLNRQSTTDGQVVLLGLDGSLAWRVTFEPRRLKIRTFGSH